MKKQRINLDTSVFGGYFDVEFVMFTKPLFDRIHSKEFIVLLSAIFQRELEPAPEKIKNLVRELSSECTEIIEENEEVLDLAMEYISENVVEPTSLADCLPITLATINQADLLVSWNFRHVVNIERIRGYNSINIKNGYKLLEIRSPRD